MFDRTVTLFNYMKSTGKWYSTVIRNCTLEAEESSSDSTRGTNSTSNVRIHLHCDRNKVFQTERGAVPYVPTKDYQTLTPSGSSVYGLTFTPERDFLVVGKEMTVSAVPDADYESGFYHYVNDLEDDVYMITNATWYSLIPHFVVGGR